MSKVELAKQDKKIQKQCQHYWIIEPPNGETSLGKCKYCGITKYFYSSFEDFASEDKSQSVN